MADLVDRYRSRGLLLDANLLVLYLVGTYDPRLIDDVRATRGFGRRDFEFLVAVASGFDRLVTTPHVLTEVNGLANIGMPGSKRWAYHASFKTWTSAAVETWEPSVDLMAEPEFLRLGLTDAAVISLAMTGPLVMSTDLDLCIALESRGLDVVNYNHLRPYL